MNNQTIVISDRNAISINNVKNVNSFNESEFLVDTPFGTLKICGKNLTIGKMDTDKQDLLIILLTFKNLSNLILITNNSIHYW